MTDPAIEVRLWRQFAVLAQELHFGRAARRLHMTQPPLTQAIARLERLLGVLLFARTQRSVQLTAAGAALLPEVQALLAAAGALPQQARDAAAGQAGRLRLAFVSTVGFGALPQWVQAFRAAHPGVRLELSEATGDVQEGALERGEIDAGLLLHTPGHAPAGLAHRVVAREALRLALPEAHPLAARRSVPLAAALAEPLVLFPRRILPSLHDAIGALYQGAGRSIPLAQEAIQMQTIVNLVSAGLGLAWVPASVTQLQRPGVAYRPVALPRGAPPLPVCETSLVWREPASPVLQRFAAQVAALAG